MHKKFIFTAIALILSCKIIAEAPPYQTSTSNQALVAKQIETLHLGKDDGTDFLLNTLAEFSVADAERIFNQLSGQQYTTLFTSTEMINRQFIRSLYNPLRLQITNPCSFNDEVYSLCSSKGIDAWTSVSGGRSFLDGNKNAQGFKMSGYGVSFGAQKRFTPCWTFGAAGFYANHHAHYNVGGAIKMNTLLGSFYTLYRPANYYALADVIFGYSKNSIHRRVNFKIKDHDYHLHSKPNISMVSFYGEVGFDWTCRCVLIQPFVGVEASRFARSGKKESTFVNNGKKGSKLAKSDKEKNQATINVNEENKIEENAIVAKTNVVFPPLSLVFPGKNIEHVYSSLGVHITTPENCYDLTFAFDLAWQYRLTPWHNKERMRFDTYGSHFNITGAPGERNSVNLGMTVWSEFMEGWTTYLAASGEVWKRVASYEFTAGVIFKW